MILDREFKFHKLGYHNRLFSKIITVESFVDHNILKYSLANFASRNDFSFHFLFLLSETVCGTNFPNGNELWEVASGKWKAFFGFGLKFLIEKKRKFQIELTNLSEIKQI